MRAPAAARLVAARVPFHYGWVVLVCVCCAGFARQGPAVATLSVFVDPMTRELGWSRTELSGAVSLGGVLAALASPLLGPLLDRRGARLMLGAAVLSTGIAALLLSQIHSLLVFYLLFCLARMNFAGPFDLGIYGAVNNWFVARRRLANAIATGAQMAGLVAMPLIAATAMLGGGIAGLDGWRAGWVAVGLTVLAVGFVPVALLMVRRPEDLGLVPDRRAGAEMPSGAPPPTPEPSFTRAEAMRTPAFWLLALYTALVFPVQAGVSLHQAPHLIERGIEPAVAATVVSAFALVSGLAGFAVGFLPRRVPTGRALAVAAALLAAGVLLMTAIETSAGAFAAAALFGLGIGGILTLTPVAWADYFGRASFGAIRGVALTVQVLAQAAGPIFSGVLRDLNGDYQMALHAFAGLAGCAVLAALLVRRA